MVGRRTFLRQAGGALAAVSGLGALACPRAAAHDGCTGPVLSDAVIQKFRTRLAGTLIVPADTAYESLRRAYASRFDPHPLLIVRASSESDIQRTVEFANVNGIRFAVRSGGHSYIGASGCDGIILDLSPMAQVSALGNGLFRVISGTQLQHVYGSLRCSSNLTLPCGSCPTVGFGGIALGGGFGYLQRAHGLTCDRVRSARVILADGTIATASPDGDADLHWAIRGGGGGSFGVASSFDVEPIPYRTIRVMVWYWPITRASEVISHMYAVAAADVLPRHTTAGVYFDVASASLPVPHCLGILLSTGSPAEAEFSKQMLVGPGGVAATPGMGYSDELSAPLCEPNAVAGRTHFRAKSSMVFGAPSADTGDVIRAFVMARRDSTALGPDCPGSVSFLTLRGAVSDVLPQDTAFRHRSAALETQYMGFVPSPNAASAEANRIWLRDLYAEVAPRLSHGGSGGYVNYPDDDLAEQEFPNHYWGANYPRLQETKRRVDPLNLFRGRQTVRP